LHLRVSPNAALFVKGLDLKWTHRELYEQFKDFGELLSCKVSIDENHRSRGYGFLQFHKEEQANKAIEAVKIFVEVYTIGQWKVTWRKLEAFNSDSLCWKGGEKENQTTF
jgi:RNA recognition motif-containing protein